MGFFGVLKIISLLATLLCESCHVSLSLLWRSNFASFINVHLILSRTLWTVPTKWFSLKSCWYIGIMIIQKVDILPYLLLVIGDICNNLINITDIRLHQSDFVVFVAEYFNLKNPTMYWLIKFGFIVRVVSYNFVTT